MKKYEGCVRKILKERLGKSLFHLYLSLVKKHRVLP